MRFPTLFLVSALLLISFGSLSFPCNKYTILFRDANRIQVKPGDITIVWRVATGYSACNQKLTGNEKFQVTIESMFADILKTDTTTNLFYRFNIDLTTEKAVIFNVREIGTDHVYDVIIKLNEQELMPMHNRYDSLNTFLLTGHFANATTILQDLNRLNEVDSLQKQREILFPSGYPGSTEFMNCYFDSASAKIYTMPYVEDRRNFLDIFKDEVGKVTPPGNFIMVRCTVSPNDSLISYETFPERFKEAIDKSISELSFDNPGSENRYSLLIMVKLEDSKKYKLFNKRALQDPKSAAFKMTYRRMPGGIH